MVLSCTFLRNCGQVVVQLVIQILTQSFEVFFIFLRLPLLYVLLHITRSRISFSFRDGGLNRLFRV